MPRTPKELVECFYHEVWNKADERFAREILDVNFRFKGSLGPEKNDQNGFIAYMRSVHAALGNYRCVIEDLVIDENRAAARMTFSGKHSGKFFGVDATGRVIKWAGAAFFTMSNERIAKLWVLGDIDSVRQQLGSEISNSFESK